MAERLVEINETITDSGISITIDVDGKKMASSVSLEALKILARVLGATVKHSRITVEVL